MRKNCAFFRGLATLIFGGNFKFEGISLNTAGPPAGPTRLDRLNDVAPKPSQKPTIDVDWNNMLDTELFHDISIAEAVNHTTSPDEDVICGQATHDFTCNIDSFVELNKKPIKRKITTKPTEKKNKKMLPSSKLLRKEKYTTTVKNWLNDVDNNILDEIIDINNKLESDSTLDVGKIVNGQVTVTNNVNKKKVIQTTLANKDGVMKYKTPKVKAAKGMNDQEVQEKVTKAKDTKCIAEDPKHQAKDTKKQAVDKQKLAENTKNQAEDTKNEAEDSKNKAKDTKDQAEDTKNQAKETKNRITKEKKTKGKFIAPIKSQIPVKDVTYDVVTLDDSNISNHFAELANIKDNAEVLAVLVYRNGFCQLNSIYTEEACIPNGILLHVNERFFFFNKFEGEIMRILSRVFEDNTVICFDGKMILIYLLQFTEFRVSTMLDAKIAGALLDPDNLPKSFSDVQKLLAFTAEYTIATESSLQKTAWYSILLKECILKLKALLVENSVWKFFTEVEMPLVPIIADMERCGMRVDTEKLKSMEQVILSKMKGVEQECHKAAGRAFQVTSPVQVRALLYDELKLDARGQVAVKGTAVTGAKSTSETALRQLISLHPLPGLILEHRRLHKAHATFLAGIAHHVRDGSVRPAWEQIAAATGRIAASNPNLQAIPKTPFSLNTLSETAEAEGALQLREVYVARDGHALLAADFRHVECRVFAALAASGPLLAALAHPDLFRALAAGWLGKGEDEVSASERERTKRVVYASLYGCGAGGLADIIGGTRLQATELLNSFNRRFPSLKAFGARVLEECSANGGRLRTVTGRPRSFPGLNATSQEERARAQRQAVNYVVQGSAADLCKIAMVRATAALAERAGAARLLLQLHDELLWEVRCEHLDWAAGVVKEAMESSGQHCDMRFPLPVAVSAGPNWAHLTPI